MAFMQGRDQIGKAKALVRWSSTNTIYEICSSNAASVCLKLHGMSWGLGEGAITSADSATRIDVVR